ncbi:MAG TPA: nitroreductase family protein [Acidobacteriota bacterium]|nr:nitroreductase family protein [Acidobacteriota bacterium]
MDFYETVEKTSIVRDFESKSVEEEKLIRILGAGLNASSHNHLRECEFIFIRDFELRKRIVDFGVIAKDHTDKKVEKATASMTEWEKPAYLAALPVQRRMLMSSLELLVVCFRMRKCLAECKTLYELNNFASV